MLHKKILKHLILLMQGKLSLREVPPLIAGYTLERCPLIRRIKRSKFPLQDIEFRPINPDDQSRYIEFFNSYFQKRIARKTPQVFIPQCREDYRYYVALYKDKIVAGVGIRSIPFKNTNLWYISGLSVLHNLRANGIGEQLLKTIISAVDDANSIILLDVNKDNDRAIRLYQKVGFAVTTEGRKFQLDNIKYSPEKLLMKKGTAPFFLE